MGETVAVRGPDTMDPEQIIKPGVVEDSPMRFYLVMIDADMARDLKLFNKTPKIGEKATNRRPSKVTRDKYVKEMRNGDWYVNPQPISFSEPDENGQIMQIDGQTRLDAVIEYDKENPGAAFPFVVCVNAPKQSMAVIDRLRRRVPADALAMSGEKNAQKLSHAARMLYAFLNVPFVSIWDWRRLDLTAVPQERFLDEHPALRQGLEEAMREPKLMQPHVVAVVWYLIQQEHGAFVAAEFTEGLISGANLGPDDPRLKLRRYFSQRKDQGQTWDGFEQMAYIITAFNAWRLRAESYTPAKAWSLKAKKFPRLIAMAQVPDKLETGI